MQYPPTSDKARITEIFSSLQGEGTHAGEKHIFVRFEECHIHCSYCDELWKKGSDWLVQDVLDEIGRLEKESGPHRYVSFTGGEPLLYVKFLLSLLPQLKGLGHKIYLETDGILAPALRRIIGLCDCVAMDMKPASVTGEKSFEKEHAEFLKTALQKEVLIKMVVSQSLDREEFRRLVSIAADIAPEVPFILQPVSGAVEGHDDPALMELLEDLRREAAGRLNDVRIMPRLHKILGIR